MSLTDDDDPPEVLFEAMTENRDLNFIFELVDRFEDLQGDEELTEEALRGAAGVMGGDDKAASPESSEGETIKSNDEKEDISTDEKGADLSGRVWWNNQ